VTYTTDVKHDKKKQANKKKTKHIRGIFLFNLVLDTFILE
jgi:hypothetical protein